MWVCTHYTPFKIKNGNLKFNLLNLREEKKKNKYYVYINKKRIILKKSYNEI